MCIFRSNTDYILRIYRRYTEDSGYKEGAFQKRKIRKWVTGKVKRKFPELKYLGKGIEISGKRN